MLPKYRHGVDARERVSDGVIKRDERLDYEVRLRDVQDAFPLEGVEIAKVQENSLLVGAENGQKMD